MKNKIEIYNLAEELITIDEIGNFYKSVAEEFLDKGLISRKVKIVSLILLDSNGKIYVQKRSENKAQSIGKCDKTIGGHVIVGDDFERALIIECAQNLGISAVIEPNEHFLDRANSIDLTKIAVCRKLEYFSEFMEKKLLNTGERFLQPYMHTFYMGYYDGDLSFINGKKSELMKYSITDLEEALELNPYRITQDLKTIINNYADLLIPIKK